MIDKNKSYSNKNWNKPKLKNISIKDTLGGTVKAFNEDFLNNEYSGS